jgi:Carboxypeptidase regulatory-like domain
MGKKVRTVPRFSALGLVAIASVLFLLGVSVPPAEAVTFRTVSGTVTDSNGHPLAGVHVGIIATETSFAITAANGSYSLSSVPQSSAPYDVQLLFPCSKDQRKSVLVNGNKTVDFTVPAAAQTDGYGYTCKPTTAAFIDLAGGSELAFPGTDDCSVSVGLPFTFRYYGVDYSSINVGTNGLASFTSVATAGLNTPIPDGDLPNSTLYPFWDDLVVDGASGAFVRAQVQGTAPNRDFVIEWVATFYDQRNVVVYAEIVLSENKRIRFLYGYASRSAPYQLRARGTSATVGIENGSGSDGLQRSFNQPYIDDNSGIEFTAPK